MSTPKYPPTGSDPIIPSDETLDSSSVFRPLNTIYHVALFEPLTAGDERRRTWPSICSSPPRLIS